MMWRVHGSYACTFMTLSMVIATVVSAASPSSHGIVMTDYAQCDKLHNIQAKFRDLYDYNLNPSHRVIQVNSTLQVRLTRNPYEFREFEFLLCKIEFVASNPEYHLLLSWHYFSVGEGRKGKDWLQVLDSDSKLNLSGAMWGTIGKSNDHNDERFPKPPPTHDYRSVGRGLTLAYRGHPNADSFIVQLTVYKDLDKQGQCETNFHKCDGGGYNICIVRSLLCNGVNNCGELNYSDERQGCYPDTKSSVPVVSRQQDRNHTTPVGLIGALLGIFVTGIILLVAATSLYCWKKRRQRHWVSGRQARAPSTSVTDINHRHPVVQNEYTQLPCHTLPRHKRSVSASLSHPRTMGSSSSSTRPYSTAFERCNSHPPPRSMFSGSGPIYDSRRGGPSQDELAGQPLLAAHRPCRMAAHNGHIAPGCAVKRHECGATLPREGRRNPPPAESEPGRNVSEVPTLAPFPDLIDTVRLQEDSPEPPPLPPHRRSLPHTSTFPRRRPPPIISHYQGPSYTASSGQSPTQSTPTAAYTAVDAGEYIRVAATGADGQIYYYLDDIAPEYQDVR